MSGAGPKDKWDSGEAYEQYVGRWSRLVAREFLSWLNQADNLRWIDGGCGTGALTANVLEIADPQTLVAVDPSDGLLKTARAQVRDERVDFLQGDAQSLPVDDSSYDVAVSGLVLNFVPDKAKAASEMKRAIKSGGTAALYVWDYAGEMQMMRKFWDAAIELDPNARELDEGVRFPICQPVPLRELFRNAGLEAVATRAIDVPTTFKDFDDYWSPFLSGQAPAPGYCMSLDVAQRERLRERLRETIETEPDGSIRMIARAWAVRGIVR